MRRAADLKTWLGVPRNAAVAAALVVLGPFLATAVWSIDDGMDADAFTNTVTASRVGATGSPVAPGFEALTEPPYYGDRGAFRLGPLGPVSKYPPGPAYFAAPAYLLANTEPEPTPIDVAGLGGSESELVLPLEPVWPAAVVTALAAAATTAALAFAFGSAGRRGPMVVVGAVALALGTSIWSVTSRELFSHTTAILGIAAGIALTARDRYLLGGLAFGLAVASRPHAAIVPLVLGVALALRHRSVAPLLGLGLGSMLGLVAVFAYNATFLTEPVSGTPPDVSTGYEQDYLQRLLRPDLEFLVRNTLGGLFSLRWGVFVWSPFLLIPIAYLRPALREAPTWVRAAALGGLLYLLIQFTIHRYNPGNQTLYRYPLEAIVACAPLLYIGWLHAAQSRVAFALAVVLVALAGAGQLTAAII